MPRRLPPLNSLRAFEAAGRTGLIKRGAEELCVTHGAISRQVQQLEDWLGVTLFEGSKHAPKLSETGRILLPALTAAFDQIESAVSQIADSEQGTLDVSCPGTFTMRWLIPRLHRFQHAYPQIEVRLNSSGTSADPIGNHVDDVLTGRLIAPHGFIQSGLGYVALKRQKTNRKADIFCQWLKTVAQEYQGSRTSQAPLFLK